MRIYLAKRQSENTMYLPDYEVKIISPSVFGNINVLKIRLFPDFESDTNGIISAFEERIKNPDTNKDWVPLVKEVGHDPNYDHGTTLNSLMERARIIGLGGKGGFDIKQFLYVKDFEIRDAGQRIGVINHLNRAEEILRWMDKYDSFYAALYKKARWVGSSEEDAGKGV